jgi:hypothetical protein
VYNCIIIGKRTESHRTKSHKTPRTKSHKTPRTESQGQKVTKLHVNLLDLNHILAIFTLPGCKTTNLLYCGLRTHRLFENLMLILRCKTTIYFIVGYTHADIFRILILFLFYVRYTWHDMTPTPYLPSKYNEVLLGLSYYNRKKKSIFRTNIRW